MLRSRLVGLVDLCARHAWPVIVVMLALASFSGVYAARHFAIKTDVNDLFPPTLGWTERAIAFRNAFPPRDITIVVDAPTGEFADIAAAKLAAALTQDHDHFSPVEDAHGGPSFAPNGLLFMPTDELTRMAGGMQQAGPL